MMITYESHSDVILAALPDVNAPVADLPAWKVPGGLHFIADPARPAGALLRGEDIEEFVDFLPRPARLDCRAAGRADASHGVDGAAGGLALR
jgi:hypothetical protein